MLAQDAAPTWLATLTQAGLAALLILIGTALAAKFIPQFIALGHALAAAITQNTVATIALGKSVEELRASLQADDTEQQCHWDQSRRLLELLCYERGINPA